MYKIAMNPYASNRRQNSTPPTFKGIPLSKKISDSLKKVYDNSCRTINFDNFKGTETFFINSDKKLYLGKVVLKISKPSELFDKRGKGKRILEIICFDPTGEMHTPRSIKNDFGSEILKKLKDKNLIEEIKKEMKTASEYLIEKTLSAKSE